MTEVCDFCQQPVVPLDEGDFDLPQWFHAETQMYRCGDNFENVATVRGSESAPVALTPKYKVGDTVLTRHNHSLRVREVVVGYRLDGCDDAAAWAEDELSPVCAHADERGPFCRQCGEAVK